MKINKININEDTIEQHALATLQTLGWDYQNGREIEVGDSEQAWRERAEQVIFTPRLQHAIQRLNPQLPTASVEEVVRTVSRILSDRDELANRNQTAYQYLRQGVKVSYQKDDKKIEDVAQLIDFQHPDNNDFLAVNQLTIKGVKGNRRPDIIGYINGLPLLVFELKNPLTENATLEKAYNQLQTYKAEIADLFVFNHALIIGDGVQAKMGSLTADRGRFAPWKVVDEKNHSQRIAFENELDGLLRGILSPENVLDYLQNFVVFEQDEKGKTIKKIAAYHQYYGVNEAVESTLVASDEHGNGKIGVVWHTQGSGKSLSMLFYAGKVLAQPELRNPTIVVVTDRNDLDGQLFTTFCGGQTLIKQTPIQANGREELRAELAKREAGGVIFTTIQKFGLQDDETAHPLLNDRKNIIVITDEAHRSQYGFNQRIDDAGQYKVGYAKHLRTALPNAAFIGFTGTPIEQDDKDTQAVFGKYVSIYDFQDAVEDGATVPIIYEARQISLDKTADFDRIMDEANALLADESNPQFKLREQLMGNEDRLSKLAKDFVAHFEKRNEVFEGKAMLVAMWQNVIKAVHDYADLDSVGCFVAGTLVDINNEDKIIEIEKLVVGDEVLSKPETGNGETAYKPVVETFAYEDKPIWLLSIKHSVAFRDFNGEIAVRYQNRDKYIFDEEKVLVTPNHPVFVVGIMNDKLTVVNFYEQPVWKRVDELQRYEVVVNADGVMYQVERAQPVYRYQGIGENTVNPDHYWYQQNYYGDFETYYQAEIEMLDGEAEPLWKTEEDYKAWGYVYDISDYEKDGCGAMVTQWVNTLKDGDEYIPFTRKVYNLEVADNHTYFVTLARLWVHNTSSPAQKLLQTARELANGVNAINETEFNSTYEIAKQYWQNAGASVEQLAGISIALGQLANDALAVEVQT